MTNMRYGPPVSLPVAIIRLVDVISTIALRSFTNIWSFLSDEEKRGMPQNPPILADRPPISEAADPLQFLLLALHFSMNVLHSYLSFGSYLLLRCIMTRVSPT